MIENKNKKPNIILILADDMGYGDLSCYGAEKILTPAIDEIAECGVRFTDAHSSSSVCTPSRYSLLTGRYCWRSRQKRGVLGGFGFPLIEEDRITVAGFLQSQGYNTGMVGKWHLGLEWVTNKGETLSTKESDGWNELDGWNENGFDIDYSKPVSGGPLDHGFEYWFGISGSLDMPPYCYIENNKVVDIPDREKNPYNPQQRKGLMSPGWQDNEVDVEFCKKAVAFLERHKKVSKDNPFFLYVATSAPHRPCVPPEFKKGTSSAGYREDMVAVFDWVVQVIHETLDRLDLTENTLFIVTSDNGARLTNYNGKDYGHKSNGDLRGGKGDIWEGGHREPFVAMWPGVIPPHYERNDLISLVDFMATCADLLDVSLPVGAAEDSISFLHTLTGSVPKGKVREELIHHSYDGMFSLRKGKWKYIEGTGSGGLSEPSRYNPLPKEPKGQLYNINDDTRENLNLWSSEQKKLEELKRILKNARS